MKVCFEKQLVQKSTIFQEVENDLLNWKSGFNNVNMTIMNEKPNFKNIWLILI
jgi:hypothetical protein